ncbi:MAG: IS982 family transposase, partial [Chitinophagaceae bacterium]
MLKEDKIIAIFCLVDDLLKGIEHQEHSFRKISDSEVITTAIVSALY